MRVLEVERVDLENNFLDSGWPRLVWSLGKRRKGRARESAYSGCRGRRRGGRTGRGFYDAEIMAMRKNKRKGAAADRPTRMRSWFNAPSTDPMGVLLASCCSHALQRARSWDKGKSSSSLTQVDKKNMLATYLGTTRLPVLPLLWSRPFACRADRCGRRRSASEDGTIQGFRVK